jgi:hypothetical protein
MDTRTITEFIHESWTTFRKFSVYH